jgi:hypothetical protein
VVDVCHGDGVVTPDQDDPVFAEHWEGLERYKDCVKLEFVDVGLFLLPTAINAIRAPNGAPSFQRCVSDDRRARARFLE